MKHPHPGRAWGMAARWSAVCAITVVAISAQATPQTFEQAFAIKGEPAFLHFRAEITSHGQTHQLEVWRDGEKRLRRSTDAKLDTYGSKATGGDEYQLQILDHSRLIHTVIDRSNLYRLGNFTDWYDLGHGLRHPVGQYTVASRKAPAQAPQAYSNCQWYELTSAQTSTQVCWSKQYRIPMLIMAGNEKVLWNIKQIDRNRLPKAVFVVDAKGYVHNDANEDMDND